MKRTIFLAGGCFWGVQKFFDLLEGVVETEVGYANGDSDKTAYEELKKSGHAESVKIIYDDELILTEELLDKYFSIIDPTSINRQGADIGYQYRTGIYYTDTELLPVIERKLDELRKSCDKPVQIELSELRNYCPAEEYHQKYLEKNPGGYCHINF